MRARSLRGTRGQTALEFIYTLAAFFVMFFAISDMVQIAHNWLGIQYASNRGIREAKMLPTSMNSAAKADVIQRSIVQSTRALGLTLDTENVTVTIAGGNINVETLKAVNISPLTGILLFLGGDHSGAYNLQVREAVANASF